MEEIGATIPKYRVVWRPLCHYTRRILLSRPIRPFTRELRSTVVYRTSILYHTCMVCFSVPYVRIWLYRTSIYVSHSIKLSVGTGGSTQKAYYSSQAYKAIKMYEFIIALHNYINRTTHAFELISTVTNFGCLCCCVIVTVSCELLSVDHWLAIYR